MSYLALPRLTVTLPLISTLTPFFLSLFKALIIGASIGGIYLYFSLKIWFTKTDFYKKLSLIVRNYSDIANESQSILSYK